MAMGWHQLTASWRGLLHTGESWIPSCCGHVRHTRIPASDLCFHSLGSWTKYVNESLTQRCRKKVFRIKKKVLIWHFLNVELLKWWNKIEMAKNPRMTLLGNAISSLSVDRDVLSVLSRVFKKIDKLATPRATVSSFIARLDLTCITCPVKVFTKLKIFLFHSEF